MANPFSHLWLFMYAVWDHAFTLAAGCVVTVVINLIEKHFMRGKKLPLKADIGILLAFVFFACFQAWRDQYLKVVALPPPQPIIQVNIPPINIPPAPAAPLSPHVGSLRDRANKLAAELYAFYETRNKGFPDCVQSANSTPAQVKACQDVQAYMQETYKMYTSRFAVRVVTVVQEFKAKGIDVSAIENCAPNGFCNPTPIPIAIRAMAARLDEKGDVRY